jgi:hypothetical protein
MVICSSSGTGTFGISGTEVIGDVGIAAGECCGYLYILLDPVGPLLEAAVKWGRLVDHVTGLGTREEAPGEGVNVSIAFLPHPVPSRTNLAAVPPTRRDL